MKKKAEKYSTKDFTLQEIEIIQPEISWKATYKLNNFQEKKDPYETTHTIVDYCRNNKMVERYLNELHDFVIEANKHLDDTDVYINKVKIFEYGEEGEEQIIIKVDYEFKGEGDGMSKATTNKVVLESDPDFWNLKTVDADNVKITIGQLKTNMFQYLIQGKKFPIDEVETKMKGDTVQL